MGTVITNTPAPTHLPSTLSPSPSPQPSCTVSPGVSSYSSSSSLSSSVSATVTVTITDAVRRRRGRMAVELVTQTRGFPHLQRLDLRLEAEGWPVQETSRRLPTQAYPPSRPN